MLYERYEKRVTRNVSILKKIYKFRILLISLASIAFFSMSGYSITKGMVYNVDIPESFMYGEEAQFHSEALFSKVSYSFRESGDIDFVDDVPSSAGDYQVEIKAKQLFGRSNTKIVDFTIEPKSVTLGLSDSTIVFGDDPVLTTTLSEGDYIDNAQFSFEDISQTETSVTVESVVIKNSVGTDVTGSYNYQSEEFVITFTPREITISLFDISDIYNGKILTSYEIEVSEGNLLEGHSIEIVSSGSQLNVGSSLNTILTATIMSNDYDVSNNYNVTYVDGSLEVTTRQITVETVSDQKAYDGSLLSNANYSIIDGSLIEGDTIHVTSLTDLSIIGVVDNVLVIQVLDDEGTDVTSNYDISYIYGQLEVTKRQITIQTDSDSKVYDGVPLLHSGIEITEGSIVNEQTIQILTDTNITNVGTIENILGIKITDVDGTDTSSNYDISFVYGELEVTPRPLAIQTGSVVFVYEGTPLSHPNYTITSGSIIVGDTLNIRTQSSSTTVGIEDNVLEIEVVDALSIDITANYDITYMYGSIEITPRPLTIKPENAILVYDGSILTSNIAEVVSGVKVDGHTIEVSTTGTQLNVGLSGNVIVNATIWSEGIDVTSNYSINFNDGTLEVTPRPITIALDDVTKVYDKLDLSSTVSSVVEGELVDGQIVEVISSGIQHNVGNSINTLLDVQIWDDSFNVSGNYDISYQNGTLEVTARPITISLTDKTKIYDDIVLTSNSVESVTISDLIEGHNMTATASGSQLNVGTSINTLLTVTIDEEGTDVTSNYDITYQDGTLEITPRLITIKAVDAIKTYDGIALTSTLVEIIDGTLVDGQTLDSTTSGIQLNAGSSLNVITNAVISDEGVNVTSNYDITIEDGLLNVSPRSITIKTVNVTKMYDGIELTSNEVEVLIGTMLDGHDIQATASGSLTNVGSSLNVITSAIILDDGIDVTNNYDITYQAGSLKITTRPIIIEAVDATKIYDGIELISNTVRSIGEYPLLNGQTITTTTLGSQLNVGSSTNSISSVVIRNGGIDVTSNYNIIFENGILEVTPRLITIQPTNSTRVYDGTVFTSTEVEFLDGTLVNGQVITITTSGGQLDVGSSFNPILTATILDDVADVTSNYDIDYQYGILAVTPRSIIIQTETDSKVYDGEELTYLNHYVLLGSLVEGHTTSVGTHTSSTNAGTFTNVLSIEVHDETGIDVTSNYDIVYRYGMLIIYKREIAIRPEDATKVYDGTLITSHIVKVLKGTIVDGQIVEITTAGSQINVGSSLSVITNTVITEEGNDVTSNYKIKVEDGLLTVTPRPITIKPVDVTKMYDGIYLTSTAVEILNGTVVDSHTIEVSTLGSILNVGSTLNNITSEIILDEYDLDVTANYIITYQAGSLEVTPRPVTIKATDITKIYDGTTLSSTTVESVGVYPVVEGQTIVATTIGNQLNVGNNLNSISTIEIYDNGIDVTSNYDITLQDGSLEVTPRPITIQPTDTTKVYDGTVLTSNDVTVQEGTVVDGQILSITTSGSQLDVGTSSNSIVTSNIIHGGTDVTSNYDITYQDGTLEVIKRSITIQTGSDSAVYDGTTLSNENYTITDGSLIAGNTINVITNTDITNVSIVENTLGIEVRNESNEDVTINYDITYIEGTLEVTPRPITVQSDSDSKVYDGLVLSNKNYTITNGSLVIGDYIEINSYTEITDVGNVANSLSVDILDVADNDNSSNYDITFIAGNLEVTPRLITVQTESDSKVYDGVLLSNENYTITSGALAAGDTINILANTDITNVGVVDNVLSLKITNSLDFDVTNNYIITSVEGTLEVSVRAITLEVASDSKVYDGTPLSNTNYVITVGSLAVDQTIEISSFTDITNVGVIDNVLSIEILDSLDSTVTSNYEVTVVDGTLEVTLRSITMSLIDALREYDGTEFTSDELESIGALDIVENQTITVTTSGTQLNVGSSANTVLTAEILDNGIDVTSNYDITYQDGVLEVIPRPITIQTGLDSKVYDGTPLSDLTYNITSGSIVIGENITIVGHTDLTIVDVIDNVLSIEINTIDDIDTTSNYAVTYEVGFLEVTPRVIVISTPSDTKVYDGTPLTNNAWELSSGSMFSDHQLTITVTGSITDIGSVLNGFTYEILDSNLEDVSMYYIVVDNSGVLEVTREKVLLVIESGSDSKTYDGLPLTSEHLNLFEGALLPTHVLEVTITGTITEVGSIANTFSYTVYDEFGVDITNDYYDVETVNGTLTVFAGDDNGDNDATGIPISSTGDVDGEGDVPTVVLEVQSEIDDFVYLRDKSYGDYNKSGWDAPVVYVSPSSMTPFLFPALAANNTLDSYVIQVKAIQNGLPYLVPYYAENGFYDNINDVYVNYTYGNDYSIDYIPQSTIDYDTVTIVNPLYQEYETAYREFVYNNYLELPRETKEALLQIAAANGLDASSATIIEDVQSYIVNAGVYNRAYKPIPDNVDFALYFLETSHEGICQHFATAGVVMYRALGIPARYVTGYASPTAANQWVTVTSDQAHAWVEIYIDGFGWVPIEVTAPSDGSGGSGTGTDSGTGETSPDLEQIDIISGNSSKQYDGVALTNPLYYYTGVLEAGHTLYVDVIGTQTLVGDTPNDFTYFILDENGIDVTEHYNVVSNYGSLVVVQSNDLEILEFQVYDIKTVYNGEVIQHSDGDYWIPSNNLPDNYTITFDIIGEIKDVGKVVTYIDKTSIRILDENSMDVTNQYNIITYTGSIEVLKRSITISSFSERKDYDGTPLTSDIFYISQGELAFGDEITVNITGSITEVGLAPNTIESVVILNSEGVDVTSNYKILKVEGNLIIDE
jgi:transglutaminase-like putative cysteine protease